MGLSAAAAFRKYTWGYSSGFGSSNNRKYLSTYRCSMISDRNLEIIGVYILSIAAVLTAWGGYQAALWSGIQDAGYNDSMALHSEAASDHSEAGRLRMLDVELFLQWMNALAEKKPLLQKFYS